MSMRMLTVLQIAGILAAYQGGRRRDGWRAEIRCALRW